MIFPDAENKNLGVYSSSFLSNFISSGISFLLWRTVPTIVILCFLSFLTVERFVKKLSAVTFSPVSLVSSQHGRQDLLQFNLFFRYKEKLEEHSRYLITNQPKFNSKLCRLLRHVLYKRTS